MSRAIILLPFVVMISTSVAMPAWAQPRRPRKAAEPPRPADTPPPPPPNAPPSGTEDARRHFERGIALFNDGNFDAALAEFEAAYRADPRPATLNNIAAALRALNRYTESIAKYEEYLKANPTAPREHRAEAERQIRQMRALLAAVTIYVIPDGATVKLDGRTVGKSPLGTVGIPSGSHSIEASAEGYKPLTKEILVTAGVPMTVELALAFIPKTGRVTINASQPRALVKIDGKNVGVTPVDVELATGGHQLEVAYPGYLTNRSELVVTAGQVRQLNVTLDRPQRVARFYDRWWFWTIVGAAAAGGTATGVVLASETQDPLRGTLSPGLGKVR